MWKTLTEGGGQFITGIVKPVMETCSESEICLAFLTVTFVGLGVRMVKRLISAFGRGR